MKKILSFLLVMILLFSLPGAAYADNFVSKSANTGSPSLLEAIQSDGSDGRELIVFTAYKNRGTLAEAQKAALVDAYSSLKNADGLAGLNADLKAAAKRNVAVSDLFDISEIEEGTVSFPMKIKLEDKNLSRFVALMHYVDGEWQWVDAEVEGSTLSFTADDLSPFAVIVTVSKFAPARFGGRIPYGTIIGAVFLGAAAALFSAKSRKGRPHSPKHIKGA